MERSGFEVTLRHEKTMIVAAGCVIGALASLLVYWGNPSNMGFCIACFLRDISGALGLHSAANVQYVRPEIIGLVLGSFLLALFRKEFGAKGGSSPLTRFVLGMFVMIGCLMFLGCPFRMILRLAGGDLNALLGGLGFVLGILAGVFFLKKGYSLKRSYSMARLEGFLFPDTYEFYQGMQASSAINKFLENFHNRITAEMLEKADERGMSMQEVVTVASMIEKEAANDDERAMIAAVIYNRIAAGMPLQIDSTIMYVLPEHKDVLTVEDTKIDSPYNTYQNTGLPPTPIANPGLASIKATLSPASTKALYYALDSESGTHKFFTSYGEFQAFVAKQSYSQ